jgi:hypothetical protein
MPGYRRYRRPPRQSTRALTVRLALIAVIVTLVVGGLLAAQMAAGNDPALGPKAAARAKKAAAANTSTSGGSSAGTGSAGSGSGYSYGDGYYGDGYGYGSGSSSSASSGYSGQQSSPAPVTSSTS